MNRYVVSLSLVALALSACATQSPVSVVDGYGKRKITYPAPETQPAVSSEEMAFNLQSEAIVSAQQEERYYVHGGDKLDQIAKHFGVSEMAILARNDLTVEQGLPVGQYIVIPSPNWVSANVPANVGYAAPVAETSNVNPQSQTYRLYNRDKQVESQSQIGAQVDVTAPAVEEKVAPGRKIELMRQHELKPGENIFRIALKYNVSQFDIMAANNISNPEDLKPGMVLNIPYAGEKVNGADNYRHLARSAPAVAPAQAVAPKTVVKPDVAVAAESKKMRKNETYTQTAEQAADAYYAELVKRYGAKRSSGKGMIWPAEGKLLKSFGTKSLGITYNGIKISVPNNAPVYAAESGTVIYSDNGLEQYGNLILVQHKGGLITAYGHNNKNLVKIKQKVAKGDLIAFAGSTGNVDKPQLHFEVRKNAQPVNPIKYLPRK